MKLTCLTCGRGFRPGRQPDDDYHYECEPTLCTCGPKAKPNKLGECGSCHRLVLSHSWHEGIPEHVEVEAA